MKRNLPPKTQATRIENRHGGGVPDLFLTMWGFPVWVELKAPKSLPQPELGTTVSSANSVEAVIGNSVSPANSVEAVIGNSVSPINIYAPKILRPNQQAWHARQMACGGRSYILAKPHGPRPMLLLKPVSGAENGSHGLLLCELYFGDSWSEMFEALRLDLGSWVEALRLDSRCGSAATGVE